MTRQVAVVAIEIAANNLHATLGEKLLRAVLGCSQRALTGWGTLSFGARAVAT